MVFRGFFPSQGTTDEHGMPGPPVPTLAALPKHTTLTQAPLPILEETPGPGIKHCSISAWAVQNEWRWLHNRLEAEGPLHITYSTGQTVLLWCVSETSISPPHSASSTCAPVEGGERLVGERAGCRVSSGC